MFLIMGLVETLYSNVMQKCITYFESNHARNKILYEKTRSDTISVLFK